VKDELARIEGVGAVRLFGAGEYSMRIWLDPNKVAALVYLLAKSQRPSVSKISKPPPVSLGAQPSGESDFQLLINVKGRLNSVEDLKISL